MAMDSETRIALQQLVADQNGLPPQLADRLSGETVQELTEDAQKMAVMPGLREPETDASARDRRGRFTGPSMSDEVRRRAGRGGGQVVGSSQTMSAQFRTAAGRTVTSGERPTGDIGIGRGSAAAGRPASPPGMSSVIRGAVRGRRSVATEFAEQIASQETS